MFLQAQYLFDRVFRSIIPIEACIFFNNVFLLPIPDIPSHLIKPIMVSYALMNFGRMSMLQGTLKIIEHSLSKTTDPMKRLNLVESSNVNSIKNVCKKMNKPSDAYLKELAGMIIHMSIPAVDKRK